MHAALLAAAACARACSTACGDPIAGMIAGTTYDAITRLTACAAADAAAAHRKGCAFVFISAAEAGWPEDTPLLPPFLRDYLAAKRAVEAHMQGLANAGVEAAAVCIDTVLCMVRAASTDALTAMSRDFAAGPAFAGRVRPVIMRPSLIWTPARPAALPPVAAFTLASMLGVPGVQRPVRVDTLANAVATAIADQRSQGVWKSKDMERAGDQR